MPVFVVGMLLVLVFSLRLRWLPPAGYVPPGEDLGGFLRHLALPVVALAAAPLATVMRMTRSSFLEESSPGLRPHRAGQGAGASGSSAWRHVLRNALLPVTSIVGLQVGSMFAGAVLVEYIFSLARDQRAPAELPRDAGLPGDPGRRAPGLGPLRRW